MKTIFKSAKLVLFVLIAIGFSSCTTGKTEGIISVLNLSDSSPVPNATVKLFVTPPVGQTAEGFYLCNEGLVKEMTYTTGSSGSTERICFKLPAVISISVTTPGGKSGVGTLSLTEEESETATVKVN
tara:strand:- start:430 stop:810 length:381 start_codon:yes stop_codon:yes gene_type:complete